MRHIPLWLDLPPTEPWPDALGHASTDVAVIGGGFAGLHTAWLLAREGIDVTLLEAERIGRAAAGRSTAKVTAQHGARYHKMIARHGLPTASLYSAANQRAAAAIAALAQEIGDTGLEPAEACLFARDDDDLATLRHERDACETLGLPVRLIEGGTELPFPTTGTLRLAGQAMIDPLRYCERLAHHLNAAFRARIHDNTRVTRVDGDGPFTVAGEGFTLTANRVVVCTHMPFVSTGALHAKAFPFAHPVCAAPLPPGFAQDTMYLSVSDPSLSLRSATQGGQPYLVAAGAHYTPGIEDEAETALADLLSTLRVHFGISAPSHVWTNHDFRAFDDLPLAGHLADDREGLLGMTGLHAWGITGSLVAAGVIAGRITGRPDPLALVYDATRLGTRNIGTLVKENAANAARMLSDRLFPDSARALDDLAPGEGTVIRRGTSLLAVHRDAEGRLSARSAVCTHMGCIVAWNHAEKTWDCPCHGSRFTPTGGIISGPATDFLTPHDGPLTDPAPETAE